MFPACSSQTHRGRGKQDYRGQIEFFAVFCPDNDKVYMVPVEEVGTSHGCLRVAATRNGQSKGVRLAEQYELSQNVLSTFIPG